MAPSQAPALHAEKVCFLGQRARTYSVRTALWKDPIRGCDAMFRTLSLSGLLACSCGFANDEESPDIPVQDGGVSETLTRCAGESKEVANPVEIFTVPEGSTLLITAACLFGPS